VKVTVSGPVARPAIRGASMIFRFSQIGLKGVWRNLPGHLEVPCNPVGSKARLGAVADVRGPEMGGLLLPRSKFEQGGKHGTGMATS
jgi:hypothetical protein